MCDEDPCCGVGYSITVIAATDELADGSTGRFLERDALEFGSSAESIWVRTRPRPEIPSNHARTLELPSDGLISFFADLDDQLNGIVGLYSWEHPGSTIVRSRPGADLRVLDGPSHGPGIRLSPLPAWTWRQDGIDFSNEEFDVMDEVDNWYAKALQGIVVEGYHHGGRHQLGGHENYIHHPAASEVVQALAGCYEGDGPGHFDYERWQAARTQVAEWRLALQIDSDEALDVMWGDVGTLFWMMRRDDIESARWDQCMFNFQSC